MAEPRLAVHGGAWNIPDELWPAHREGCAKAHASGMAVLARGGPAVEAVAAAIRVMEDDPTFDAGRGSFLNERGEVELDAGVMEGRRLASGAVLGVSRVKNPIDLAVYIMTQDPHCLYTGEGGQRLAERAGLPLVEPTYHVLERELATHRRIVAGDRAPLAQAWTDRAGDTVGAIALDASGDLAAGNSTGGVLHKAVGRVGDAPLIGSGFYADNERGAVLCTGWGEPIMRSGMAMRGLFLMERHPPKRAAELAVEHLRRRVGGYGGMLLMRPDGVCGAAYNTGRMAFRLEPAGDRPA